MTATTSSMISIADQFERAVAEIQTAAGELSDLDRLRDADGELARAAAHLAACDGDVAKLRTAAGRWVETFDGIRARLAAEKQLADATARRAEAETIARGLRDAREVARRNTEYAVRQYVELEMHRVHDRLNEARTRASGAAQLAELNRLMAQCQRVAAGIVAAVVPPADAR